MGIYDRDYERGYSDSYGGGGGWRPEGQAGGMQLRMPTTVVGWVLLVNIVVYLLELGFQGEPVQTAVGFITPNPLIDFFHLQSDWYLQPWRVIGLLTYGFLHAPENFMHIAGNMFGFWLFGRELERRFGSREFLLFYLAAILIGGVAFCVGETLSGEAGSAIGASAGTVAVTILFAVLYPHLRILFMLVIPMPMWVLGCLIVAGDILGGFARPDAQVAFTAHLGGAAFAFLYYKMRWRLSNWAPEQLALPSFKRRPKLRVHREDDDFYSGAYDRDDDPEEDMLEEELNAVLAKISEKGQDSLTRKERRILEKASRRAQQRRQ